MVDHIPLETLLLRSQAATRVVALRAGKPVDFASFEDAVSAWRMAFSAASGQNWAVFMEDSVDFATVLFGAWHAGKCVYLPSDALPGTIKRLSREVDGFVGEFSGMPTLSKVSVPKGTDWGALDREAEALVIYTSGTSGEPVSIPKKLGQLFAEVDIQIGCWGRMFENAAVQSTVTHQHIYGLLFRILVPLATGRPFAAERLLYPEDIVAALRASEAMVLVASPAHLKRLPEGLPWDEVRDRLCGVFSSGGPLPDQALSDCLALLGQAPIEIYGSSETGGVAWRQQISLGAKHWRLLPGVEMRSVQGVGQVRSAHLPDSDWFLLSDRVSLSGDVGEFDLFGRVDRIVKIEEKRVSLTAVEQALSSCDLVGEARVLPLYGERVVLGAVIVLSEKGWELYRAEGKRALNEHLHAWLGGELGPCALPRRWRYSWSLPVNAQGKTTEQMLISFFDSRRPSACLLERSEYQAMLRIDVDADSPFFDGHFSQYPILPGVTQIEWAICFGRELFAVPPVFLRMESIKFQQVIQPGASVMLMLELNAERGCLGFKLTSEAGTHAGGRICFGETA